jgi:alpha-beta hydrolase superfamily lysophospholipase
VQDVLGQEYEATTLALGHDDEGEVVATLVARRLPEPSRKAVLYVHGFVDYFFQTHLADFYLDHGFDFYALDLRKYGRSLRPWQTPNFVHSLSDYFPEIDEAVRIIREDHDELIVNAHSTGGLITPLWADRVRGKGLLQGLFLNSPFFDMNVPVPLRVIGDVTSGLLRGIAPLAKLPVGVSTRYVDSLHRDYAGEWDFDLAWKPRAGFGVRAGWLAAIRRAQRRLQAGLAIDVPVLVMASGTSVRPSRKADLTAGDAVLNVEHMVRWAPRLGEQVTVVRIEGGLHDLVLSAAPVRERVFKELTTWLETTGLA